MIVFGALHQTFEKAQLNRHFLRLDDIAGASLVSSWGWLAWPRTFEIFTANATGAALGAAIDLAEVISAQPATAIAGIKQCISASQATVPLNS